MKTDTGTGATSDTVAPVLLFGSGVLAPRAKIIVDTLDGADYSLGTRDSSQEGA